MKEKKEMNEQIKLYKKERRKDWQKERKKERKNVNEAILNMPTNEKRKH